MNQVKNHGGWGRLRCVSAAGCAVAAAVFQVVDGRCGDQRTNSNSVGSGRRRQSYQEDKCWYELWYFWFIVALVFLTVTILVLFFCKQQVKRSTGRQGRRCTPVLAMPTAPPQYEVPGHQPPPYHIAISSPPVAFQQCPPPGSQCPPCHPYEVFILPPGYVGAPPRRERDADYQLDSMSVTSVGALSNPPPYSPPRSTYRPCLNGEHQQPQ